MAPLDSLRGFAALTVALFSHYQHFGGDHKRYPFMRYDAVAWLYQRSWLFVDFFFLLSGIVLTYRYLASLGEQRTGARDFFFLRLSRLYPLQVATLLVCAAIQWSRLIRHQPTIIYGSNNDLYHFFLQLTYLHVWFEAGWSYNEPSWSVCGEVFVYMLFFVFAARRPKSYVLWAILTVFIGIAVQTKWVLALPTGNMGRAMVGFFAGSLLWLGLRRADPRGLGRILGWACLTALVAIVVLTNLIGYDAWIGARPLVHSLAIFPLVLVAALRVPILARVLALRPLTFLGDISYAVYLCHVPTQMIALMILDARHLTVPTEQPWVLGVYALVLLAVATAVHYGLEIPARRWLRNKSVGRAMAPPSDAVAV
ncbi:MAG TPA: acyltransferase [Polyangia bacterium]|nr:acyltransferase [Polyangia bacterium]